jgi:pyrroline-5-carboxylate reductase
MKKTVKRSDKRRELRREIGFIGAGNMATALVKGLIDTGLYAAEQIIASDVDGKQRNKLRRRFGVHVTDDNVALLREAKVVVLALKPQSMDDVLGELRGAVTPDHLFISIAAGVTSARIEARLAVRARVLRVMPNTPALLGKGMSVLVRGLYATAADEKLGLKLFGAVGDAVAAPDERMLDAVTGLSGSGPAYVYRFAEAMLAGGIAAGLPGPMARQLTIQTLVGAAAMLKESGEPPETLRARVSSPGGTTLAGLSELEHRGFKEAVSAAIIAATRRSQELGRGSR